MSYYAVLFIYRFQVSKKNQLWNKFEKEGQPVKGG